MSSRKKKKFNNNISEIIQRDGGFPEERYQNYPVGEQSTNANPEMAPIQGMSGELYVDTPSREIPSGRLANNVW